MATTAELARDTARTHLATALDQVDQLARRWPADEVTAIRGSLARVALLLDAEALTNRNAA